MRIRGNLRARIGRLVRSAGGATRADVRRLTAELERLRAELSTLEIARIDSLEELLHALEERHSTNSHSVEELEKLARIEAVMRWISHARLATNPLVSVILPTRERPERLRRAIGSVVAQRYPNWELLIVDDGGSLDSRYVAEAFEDPRISWQRIEHTGAGAARNVALRAARGELIAYLDDDNLMDRDWLYAVVWAFEQRPEVDTLYGAFVIDEMLPLAEQDRGELESVRLHPFRREALREGNFVDMGAIAHRAGLPEAHFDESIRVLLDWDLLVRLTAEKDPLVLPAIACYYTTDAPARLTLEPRQAEDLAKISARAMQRLG